MSHQRLMEMLPQRIEDKALLNLINQWLTVRVGIRKTEFYQTRQRVTAGRHNQPCTSQYVSTLCVGPVV